MFKNVRTSLRLAPTLCVATCAIVSAELQAAPATPSAPVSTPVSTPKVTTVVCASKPGERIHCAADVSQGITLLKSNGSSACLLGKTWGYDDGIWVADGCSGEFVVAGAAAGAATTTATAAGAATAVATPQEAPDYVPNAGFLLYNGDKGQIYMRLFAYARYLDQMGLDPTYTDYFGNEHDVQQRQDIQLNKFFLPFSGWFMTPQFRYYLYVWSSNPSQGDPAQVVGAGNLSYSFNRHVTFGAGITSLPSVRSTEGQFPYWLTVDNRLIADEFFRGSYTSGIWFKGELSTTVKYMAMLGNNLSTLGVNAKQLDNTLDTTSLMLQWLPTTGEFGLYGTFGDYDWHDKLATRLGLHFTESTEDKQSQPGTNDIENSQIRLTDGSVIFTPNLFGPGISVTDVHYQMISLDGGLKYKGMSFEPEFYWRKLDDFNGPGVDVLEQSIDDYGFQVQVSAMFIKDILQGYAGVSEIRGDYGDGSDARLGVNWYPFSDRGVRVNAEWINLENSPVGYTAVPYSVGGNGDVFSINLEMNW